MSTETWGSDWSVQRVAPALARRRRLLLLINGGRGGGFKKGEVLGQGWEVGSVRDNRTDGTNLEKEIPAAWRDTAEGGGGGWGGCRELLVGINPEISWESRLMAACFIMSLLSVRVCVCVQQVGKLFHIWCCTDRQVKMDNSYYACCCWTWLNK